MAKFYLTKHQREIVLEDSEEKVKASSRSGHAGAIFAQIGLGYEIEGDKMSCEFRFINHKKSKRIIAIIKEKEKLKRIKRL